MVSDGLKLEDAKMAEFYNFLLHLHIFFNYTSEKRLAADLWHNFSPSEILILSQSWSIQSVAIGVLL